MEKDTRQESAANARTKSLWVHGRSLWNEADASLSFDWAGTQICFRVLGSPAEVHMLASIGEDVLSVYADGCWQRKIGPSSGRKETFLLVRDAPEDCRISIVKVSEPNLSMPITIYDVWASPSARQDGFAPCIGPLDIGGYHPGFESMFECVGDSDTSALYNMARSAPERHDDGCSSQSVTTLDSDIEQGWPFFLAESLGFAPPMVVALSGVGVHAGPHRPESLADYYPRLLCCRKDSQNSAPRDDMSAGSSQEPLCVLVFVGGNDFVTMPRDSPAAQSSFLKNFVSAHQTLLQIIRHRRPSSPIVSLYGDADSCSGCHSVDEQQFISSSMQRAVLESVAGLGGAQFGFFSCLVQPNIRLQCPSDWSHDMHWGPTGHEKFAAGLKKALLALALREEVQRKGEQRFPGMVTLAAMLSPSQPAAAGRVSAESAVSEDVNAQGVPDASAIHTDVKDGGVLALQIAGVRLQSCSPLHVRAMEGDAEATALLLEGERCLLAVDSAVRTPGETTFRRLTPLHLAAFAGHPSVTRALLASHAFARFVNACAEEEDSARGQWSALHVAAHHGHASVATCLLHSENFSQDLINAVTGKERTALHLACFAGYAEVAQLLLDEDRFTAVDAATAWDSHYDGHTALTIAITKGHESIACLLLWHCQFHAFDTLVFYLKKCPQLSQEVDALLLMAWHGMQQGVQCYLEVHSHRKPDAFVRLGAVHAAADGGHDHIIEILTTHPAVDIPAELAYVELDEHGQEGNALHLACYRGHKRVVERLLRLSGCEGAINAHNGKDKATALHVAVFKGHADIALCLLQSDSFMEVNAVDSGQRTALYTACELKFEHIAMEIIQHPLFTMHHVRCSRGKTPLMVAEESNLRLVAAALAQI